MGFFPVDLRCMLERWERRAETEMTPEQSGEAETEAGAWGCSKGQGWDGRSRLPAPVSPDKIF